MGSDSSGSDSVQCITDLSTCCSGAQGNHHGDWYFPDGTRLPFYGHIYESRKTRELTYVVVTIPPHQLVSIAVIFQLLLSMMVLTVH